MPQIVTIRTYKILNKKKLVISINMVTDEDVDTLRSMLPRSRMSPPLRKCGIGWFI